MSYANVLVGTDGSDTAERAVKAASRVAARLGVPLVTVTAWQRQPVDPPPPSQQASYPAGSGAAGAEAHWATATTTDAAAIARREGVAEVRQVQPIGRPAEALLEVAGDTPDALLVVGTYGLSQRSERLVGNVPHALSHHSPVDLLLTTAGAEPSWERIAIATDGSPTAARAVAAGLELAAGLSATATLLTIARDAAHGRAVLERTVEKVPVAGTAEQEIGVGADITRGLRDLAPSYDLLVIGNKGMSGPSRLLGSVANRVTHDVPTDLLLVNTAR